MKIRKRSRFAADVSTSSLNDIMFFLLLFFLIISTMANPNVIRLLLPKAKTAQQLNQQQVILSVTKSRQYYIDNRPVTFDQLEPTLATLAAARGQDAVILIRADRHLEIQDLVDVMAIGAKIKVKMVLGTDKNAS